MQPIGQRTQCTLEAVGLTVLQGKAAPDVQPTDPSQFIRNTWLLILGKLRTLHHQ